jgi:hypothetical protein
MESAEEIVKTLRDSTDSEVSNRILAMSERLKGVRINELSSKRESEELRAR